MLHRLKLKLSIRFSSKWHTGSGEGNILTDRLLQRDARGFPYIPGSTLKGVIRENCEKLSRTCGFPEPSDPHSTELGSPGVFRPLAEVPSPVDRLFGNKFEEGGLFFRNACLKKDENYETFFQTRVRMNRKLGTAKDAHLFSSEYGFSPGKRDENIMTFETAIDGFHQNLAIIEDNDPPYAYCLLVAAICMTDRLGGDKSTGAGQLEKHITITSFQYNGKDINPDKYFEETAEFYLDASDYMEWRNTL